MLQLRFRASLLTVLILHLFVLPVLAVEPALVFLHVTDTHVQMGKDGNLPKIAEQAKKLSPLPQAVVITGDLTNDGTPEQFELFRQAIAPFDKIPVQQLPGNHDYYSPAGRAPYLASYPNRYRSFDLGGFHFVLLDSAFPQYWQGHMDNAELKWLNDDLKKQRKGTPVLIFLHHLNDPQQVALDNQELFRRTILPYNIVAIFTGHGHRNVNWKMDGIPCFEAANSISGSYEKVEKRGSDLLVTQCQLDGKEQLIATVPIAARPRYSVAFVWDDAQVPVLERRQFLTELRLKDKQQSDAGIQASYSIDMGDFTPMQPDKRDRAGLSFITQLETKTLLTGGHRVQIHIKAPDSTIYEYEDGFEVARLQGVPSRIWTFQAPEGIIGNLKLDEKSLSFSCADGKDYTLDAANGKVSRKINTMTPALPASSPLAVIENGLRVSVNPEGRMTWKDVASGKTLYEHFLEPGWVVTRPILKGRITYIGSMNGLVTAIKLPD